MKIKYDMILMKYMSIFESITRAVLRDCIVNEDIMFIVKEGEMGKAIGKKGSNVRMLEKTLKKKIRIVEFNNNMQLFIKNLVAPVKLKGIEEKDSIVYMEPIDLKSRGILIGRNAATLRHLESIIKRYFPIKELKVQWGTSRKV